MWTGWLVQTNTKKQEHWMIQAYQFFNKPVVTLSIIVHMAHEMVKHRCNLQHGPTTFLQNRFVNSSMIVH